MKKVIRDLIIGKKTVVVSPDDSVLTVAKKLKAKSVGAAPVAIRGKLVGIFTERDLLKRVVAAGKDAKKLKVSKVMTKKPVTAPPTTGIFEALEVMRVHNCRHLPVVAGDALLGIISQRDLITAILLMKDEEVADLKEMLDLLPVEPGVG